jgi:hypothetical protein
MKLCSLFESIETPDTIKGRFQSELYWTGIHAANLALPRKAIEEAISVMEIEDISPAHIEQLRALLPEEE